MNKKSKVCRPICLFLCTGVLHLFVVRYLCTAWAIYIKFNWQTVTGKNHRGCDLPPIFYIILSSCLNRKPAISSRFSKRKLFNFIYRLYIILYIYVIYYIVRSSSRNILYDDRAVYSICRVLLCLREKDGHFE